MCGILQVILFIKSISCSNLKPKRSSPIQIIWYKGSECLSLRLSLALRIQWHWNICCSAQRAAGSPTAVYFFIVKTCSTCPVWLLFPGKIDINCLGLTTSIRLRIQSVDGLYMLKCSSEAYQYFSYLWQYMIHFKVSICIAFWKPIGLLMRPPMQKRYIPGHLCRVVHSITSLSHRFDSQLLKIEKPNHI